MDQETSILFEHYRDSNSLTGGLRRERSRFFVYLMIAIAIGVLLSFNPEASARFVVTVFASFLGLDPAEVVNFLPYHIVDALLLAVVFFFMVNLYQRSVLLLGYYSYIALVETELRARLKLADDSVAFTREGEFYWANRPTLQGWTKYFYAIIIAFGLGLYLVRKVAGDWSVFQGLPDGEAYEFWSMVPLIVDGVVGLPIVIVFVGYVVQAIGLDQKPNRGEVALATKAAQAQTQSAGGGV